METKAEVDTIDNVIETIVSQLVSKFGEDVILSVEDILETIVIRRAEILKINAHGDIQIPQAFLKRNNWRTGDVVEFKVIDKGKIGLTLQVGPKVKKQSGV